MSWQGAFADELEKMAISRGRLNVPKARSGRRSMSVDTLLRKEKDGTLYKNATTVTDQTSAVYQEVDPKNPTVTPKSLFARGDVPSRDDIPGRVGAEFRPDMAGSTLAKTAFKLQGHTEIQGIGVAIENRRGSVREGKNEDGTKWRTKFKIPYGYIKGTKGADNEEIDAYVGPDRQAPTAFVAHQKKQNGQHDEDTVMLGFKSKEEARRGILDHYDDPGHIGGVTAIPIERLKQLLSKGQKITKLSKRMDEREGDVPTTDQTGRAGVNWRSSSGGPAEPPRPETAERFFVGNVMLGSDRSNP